jgi:hypothetical protein
MMVRGLFTRVIDGSVDGGKELAIDARHSPYGTQPLN